MNIIDTVVLPFSGTVREPEPLTGPLDFFLADGESSSDKPNPESTDSDGFEADEFYVILDKPYKYSADVDLDTFVANEQCLVFRSLHEHCRTQIPTSDKFQYMSKCKDVTYIELYDSDQHCSTPRIKSSISVSDTFELSIHVHEIPLPAYHPIWQKYGRLCYSVASVRRVLEDCDSLKVCCGNQDETLQDLVPVGDSQRKGYRESFYIGSTIRSVSCSLLIKSRGSRCKQCLIYRRTLLKLLSRRISRLNMATPQKEWTKSHTNNLKLNDNKKQLYIKLLK